MRGTTWKITKFQVSGGVNSVPMREGSAGLGNVMKSAKHNNAFVCRRCGRCCRESGYVYLSDSEVDAIAGRLGMDIEGFTERYTRLTQHRDGLSLVEQDNGACIFLSEGGDCLIQAVKPLQCRQFPFVWRYRDVQAICKGWSENENRND